MPSALTAHDITYQRLAVSVVSAIGAHRNFHVCGMKLAATSAAISSTDRPACDSRYPIATEESR